MSPLPLRWRWRELAWIALALVIIVVLRKHESTYEQRSVPIKTEHRGMGRAQGRNFAVEVKNVKAAHAYLLKGDFSRPEDYTLRTPGIWLSVLANTEALERPGVVSAQLVTRDGLTYAASSSDRPKLRGINLQDRFVSPGLPESGAFFFEVPPDRLRGAHLQFYWSTMPMPREGDSLIDMDPGIDEARARKLLADAKPVLDLRP